jgi:tetratricopeptide (TPR) repeat protein
MGKSMLCWQWVKAEVRRVMPECAGIFWYSFYERGADMGDLCAHALAFTTKRPIDEYSKRKTADLAAELIPILKERPWLLVLDGLERVLVAYNRYDAAQVRDDELDLSRKSAKRKAQDCIRPADSNLLRTLTEVAPTKVLISSRLMPSALLNSDGAERNGVAHLMLTGLEASDAEIMLRSIGLTGDSARMRNYLTKNFGCHPLIVGIAGGLVNKFAKAPGDFDRWLDNQANEYALSTEADLVRSRHRILWAAFEDLMEDSRTLLARIALVSEAVDYPTLVELNPRRPDPPEPVYPPDEWLLQFPEYLDEYNNDKQAYEAYKADFARWRNSPAFVDAEHFLREALQDLLLRGLLQCDRAAQKYDLHPVVRGYAVSSIAPAHRDGIGGRVVDHFSSRQDQPSETVQNINDLRNGLQVVRTLLHLGRFEQAANAINNLSSVLFWSLEAHHLYLSLVRPLFRNGWRRPPLGIESSTLSWLWNDTAVALAALAQHKEAIAVHELVLDVNLDVDNPGGVLTSLSNLALATDDAMQFHAVERLDELVAQAALTLGNDEDVALSYLDRATHKCRIGDFESAERLWSHFDALPRPGNRSKYRSGYGEYHLARLQLFKGTVEEGLLSKIDQLAIGGNSRWVIRAMSWLRGEWHLSRSELGKAAKCYEEYIRLTREANMDAYWAEARQALAQLKLGESHSFRELADRISAVDDPPNAALAELYLALGEHEKARRYVQAGYVEAWSAGPPYVCWRTLQHCRRIFEALGDPEPQLVPFDDRNAQPFSFEAKLSAYLQKKEQEKCANRDDTGSRVM